MTSYRTNVEEKGRDKPMQITGTTTIAEDGWTTTSIKAKSRPTHYIAGGADGDNDPLQEQKVVIDMKSSTKMEKQKRQNSCRTNQTGSTFDNDSFLGDANCSSSEASDASSPPVVPPTKVPLMHRLVQDPIRRCLTDKIAVPAARRPLLCIGIIALTSVALAIAGVLTNFRIENNETALWTPRDSLPEKHSHWIQRTFDPSTSSLKERHEDNTRRRSLLLQEHQYFESNQKKRRSLEEMIDAVAATEDPVSSSPSASNNVDGETFVVLLVHAEGQNVISQEGQARHLEALDRARTAQGYREYCNTYGQLPCPSKDFKFICFLYGVPIDSNAERVCPIAGVSAFWFHNSTIYKEKVDSDLDVQETVSLDVFPGEEGVFDVADFLGYPVYESRPESETEDEGSEQLLVSAKSYLAAILLPGPADDNVRELEERMVEQLLQLQSEWDADPTNTFRVEIMSFHSFEDEFTRGIYEDLWLIPFTCILMSAFTAMVFWKRDSLHSRTMLGVAAVGCITMSLCTAYGLMFIIGLPFTNLSLALLLIVFGIGLDDTFIIYSAYVRTDHSLDIVERIRETMDEVSVSIFMTTATTEVAFFLGCFSPIPAIRWLCVRRSMSKRVRVFNPFETISS